MSSENDKYDYKGLMERNSEVKAKVKEIINDKGISEEDAFKEFLKTDNMFEDISYCSKCYAKQLEEMRSEKDEMRRSDFPPGHYECEKEPSRGLPILEAEKLRFMNVRTTCPSDLSGHLRRELGKEITNTFFAICPECLNPSIPVRQAPGLSKK
jgi:hypothetical protein